MNKNKKKCILAIAGLFLLIITAASVSADEDDEPGILDRDDINLDTFDENETNDSDSIDDELNLIAPSPDNDLEPLIIAPMDTTENEEALSEDNAFTTGLILVVGISAVAGLAIALIIFKK